jgi:LuxR family transcriptional regulator, maltose regulon positive regulatory protein
MSRLPAVRDEQLIVAPGAAQVPVGTSAWFDWLQGASSFTFAGTGGTFTARHEDRAGHRFWYAYRRQEGRLHKTYLGRVEELTMPRLEQAAHILAEKGTAAPGSFHSGQSSPLIATKLIVPHPGLSLVARPAVVERCLESLERPCTLLAAPAGFGKTTLLVMARERLKERGWAVAWVSLEESERDPVRFWRYVLAALDGIQPGLSSAPLRLLETPRPAPIESTLTVLINALAAATNPIVLVLDDYHRAATQASDHGLAFLLDHLPPALHLVVATRSDPTFPLARLRAQGRLAELHAADLCFSLDEAEQFLRETMGVSLSAEQLAWLEQQTEGWVAGLQLAALSLRDHANVPDRVADSSATPRYLAEYLLDEVLAPQPAEVQAFLLQTAPLERLTGPLCDAVTGRRDSAAMLARLMQAHLFVTPLDAGQTWYRYHQLFAEVLCEWLQRTAPAELAQVRRRAADWFLQQEMMSEAIRHLLAAQAFSEAATQIEGESDRLVLRGETAGLVAWVRALPRDVLLTHPHLCVLFAGGLLLQGANIEVAVWLDALEQRLADKGTLSLDLEGEIGVIRAYCLLEKGDTEAGIRLAQQATLQLAPENQALRTLALWITAIMGMLGEQDLHETEQAMAVLVEESVRDGNVLVAWLALIGQAEVELYQGRLHRAEQTCREALRLISQIDEQGIPFIVMVYSLLGEVRREWNDLDGAERDLRHALDSSFSPGNPKFFVEGPISLALVQAARGKSEEALAMLEELRSQGQIHQIALWDRMQVESMQMRVLLAQGNLVEAAHWAEQCQQRRQHQPTSAPGLFRDLEDLSLARVALAQGHVAEVVAPLEDLCARATRAGRWRFVLEAKMLLALAHWMSGEADAAMRDLGDSLALAAPEGFVRVFLDEGAPLADLLASYVAKYPSLRERTHALKLLSAFGRLVEPAELPLGEALSPRELDVVRLLARGRSNEAIARELVVARSTVKWHVAQIYRKLDVTGRVQAVTRARELHLLG